MPTKSKSTLSRKSSPQDLTNAIARLEKRVKRANALRWVFVRGLVTGVGTALGATIIAGVAVWFLYQVVSTLEFVPIINDLIDQTPLAELLEQEVNGTQ